jgi:hypothetical protein
MNPVRLATILVVAGVILILGTIGAFAFFFHAQE